MPPTDGQVVLSTPSNNSSNNSGGGGGASGDSNAALAANSALSVPFSCNFCQRSFPRLSLLKKHEQVKNEKFNFFKFHSTIPKRAQKSVQPEPKNKNQFVIFFFFVCNF